MRHYHNVRIDMRFHICIELIYSSMLKEESIMFSNEMQSYMRFERKIKTGSF